MIGTKYRCLRLLCGHRWYSRVTEAPKSCPKCKKYRIEAVAEEQ